MVEPTPFELVLDHRDLEFTATRGSGPGGQNRNKVCSCVIVKHIPTGVTVRCETERDQHRNKAIALSLLRAKMFSEGATKAKAEIDALRKNQVGSGMRGDKRRTIRVQDGTVNDHVSGRSWSWDNYVKGKW